MNRMEIKEMFTGYSLLTINERATQLNRAIDECRREYEISINAVDSQKGVIQPQLITPAQILEQVKHSQVTFHYQFLRVPLTNTY